MKLTKDSSNKEFKSIIKDLLDKAQKEKKNEMKALEYLNEAMKELGLEIKYHGKS